MGAARFDIAPLKTRTNLTLELDTREYGQTLEQDIRIVRFVRGLQQARVFDVEHDTVNDRTQVLLRSHSLGRENRAEHPLAVLNTLYNNVAMRDTLVPQVKMTPTPLDASSHRYGMMTELRWPSAEHIEEASVYATEHMQRFAAGAQLFREPRQCRDSKMVFVQADRSRGITVETNHLGSCNISAGGDDYDPDSDTVTLWQHNLYTTKQQLACLVGAVGFATAHRHLDE